MSRLGKPGRLLRPTKLLMIRLLSEGAHVNSTLKIQNSEEAVTLIEKIKAEIKKRAEAKAKRMLFKRPKRLAKRCG